MQPGEIETFLAIAHTRSISGAAKLLFITQSTATHRLRTLEEELGTQLVERGRGQRRVELTPKGEAFVPLAQRWMSVLDQMQSWRETSQVMELCVGSHEAINTYVLLPVLQHFVSYSHDTIRIEMRSKSNKELYSLMNSAELDMAFVTEDYNAPDLDVEIMFKEDFMLIHPRCEGLDEAEPVGIMQLDHSREITLLWSYSYLSWREDYLRAQSNRNVIVDILPLANLYLQDGRHWMVAPATTAAALAETFGLGLFRLEFPPPPRIYYMLTHSNAPRDKAELTGAVKDEIYRQLSKNKWLKTIH